jgi:uncharacterized protein (TIGR03437 family)
MTFVKAATRVGLTVFLILLVPGAARAQSAWQLIWSDEFNGALNSPPDPAKWTYDLGNDNGWGNGELETYTSLPQNSHMDGNGNLVIYVEAGARGYSSARIKTQGLFQVQYGRIEARIKLPFGQGIWPAFWMLGANANTVGWPQCGEVDIMENIGKEPFSNHASVHGPGYSGGSAITAAYTLSNGRRFADDFHTFAVQWSPGALAFYVDGVLYDTVTPSGIPRGSKWVFDGPFFLLLNVAVGGDYPGPPDLTTQFPQSMLVDYVRVYQQANVPAPVINSVIDGASYGAAMAPGSMGTILGGTLGQAAGDLFDPTLGTFRSISAAGTSVLVDGLPASLTYVSPSQINFQVPWESLTGTLLNVEVMTNNILSNPVSIQLSSSAPSVFSSGDGAFLVCSDVPPRSMSMCTLWGNGFGPTNPAQRDGAPSTVGTVASTVSPCLLTVGGKGATVTFCGAAPGQLIYQLNFIYPSAVEATSSTIPAEITINGNTGRLLLPVK